MAEKKRPNPIYFFFERKNINPETGIKITDNKAQNPCSNTLVNKTPITSNVIASIIPKQNPSRFLIFWFISYLVSMISIALD
ncbi:hypothetical protein D1818_09870 [Aquimarina sp. BL5]|uniref:hypothetical protein n=1 Tax=Aquimarina sp. BL5 TaxID=1714860 RepID=UPI000E4AC713|nr:hypothetical protein [Aquimarina sp. BL5]AXT51118.1 hypothetical protein D1818_09870 [Aquimarina sp. BL5]RKN06024.1 hypothetical protein D7036_09520 [Aquimarina sp. BL5]